MKKSSTKRSAFRHCRARAQTRYGIKLTEADYDQMCALASKERMIPKANGCWFVVFVWGDKAVKGTWDGNRLVTLLPSYADAPFLCARGETDG